MADWVWFSSDVVVWVATLLFVAQLWSGRRSALAARVWGDILRQPLATASLLVLVAYLSLALLDSLHWRALRNDAAGNAGTEVVSALDVLLTPARLNVERSYSAPLSTVAFAREVALVDGERRWVEIRLEHGGRHLVHPEAEWWTDVLGRGLAGVVAGTLAGGLMILAASLSRHFWMPAGFAWRTATSCTLTLTGIGGVLAALMPYYHVLGTDQVGNDILYQGLKSIRTGVVMGALTTAVGVPIAVVLGLAAGYFRGWVDDAVQYLYTTVSSVPSVLLIAASVLMVDVWLEQQTLLIAGAEGRADLRLICLCVILGATGWTGLCRLLRAETLKLRELEFVQASRVLGVRPFMLLSRHLLPNVFHLILIAAVLDFSGLVLAEAVLAYVNIGVDAATHSWGNMINKARGELARDPVVWWSLATAFFFMFFFVLAANLLGDALREAHDPRLRRH